ncbi:UxaA family hydrolase [Flavivirga rizhaonensis]|uniref:Altronate hydrolase n=1 Tax=Flavivirga rizhaonensis TaxID=2559571 RepID=A0A4S1DSK8_9FLAO|nr:UxaA family hydrolase [Flavivirga rizhaonensis]TGV00966.1 altronate hydrolase [Flavivirga rizhaonensis]
MSSRKIIVLNASDNVGVVISNLSKDEKITIDGEAICAISDIDFGHKIALKDLPIGALVKKYGVPIGVITQQVHAGEHIHVHNMESLYMKQFTK